MSVFSLHFSFPEKICEISNRNTIRGNNARKINIEKRFPSRECPKGLSKYFSREFSEDWSQKIFIEISQDLLKELSEKSPQGFSEELSKELSEGSTTGFRLGIL